MISYLWPYFWNCSQALSLEKVAGAITWPGGDNGREQTVSMPSDVQRDMTISWLTWRKLQETVENRKILSVKRYRRVCSCGSRQCRRSVCWWLLWLNEYKGTFHISSWHKMQHKISINKKTFTFGIAITRKSTPAHSISVQLCFDAFLYYCFAAYYLFLKKKEESPICFWRLLA